MIEKTITIVTSEKKTITTQYGEAVQFTIFDQENNKYTFFKNIKGGGESKAYQVFKTLGVEPEGKTISIGYEEVSKEISGKQITFRNIRWIDASLLDRQTPGSTQTPLNAPINGFPEQNVITPQTVESAPVEEIHIPF